MKGATSVDRYIGRRLRKRRNEMAMSQMALAKAVGVSWQTIQKYEAATTRIAASRLYELARALGVEVGFFFADMPRNRRNNSNHKGK
jgi:transcriptional regulator with XRE-family HTH domain